MLKARKKENKVLKARKKENYEAMIENRNALIGDLVRKNQEQKLVFNKIIKELYSNVKTDKQKIDKVKELVSDYQSIN